MAIPVFSVRDWLAASIGCSPGELELVSQVSDEDYLGVYFALDGQPYGRLHQRATTALSKSLVAAWGNGRSAHIRLDPSTIIAWEAPQPGRTDESRHERRTPDLAEPLERGRRRASGRRLRQFLESRRGTGPGWVGDLAQQLGVSRGTVSTWINGSAEPDLGSLRRLAQVLKIPPWQVLATIDGQDVPVNDYAGGSASVESIVAHPTPDP